jgi:hypothetical protein
MEKKQIILKSEKIMNDDMMHSRIFNNENMGCYNQVQQVRLCTTPTGLPRAYHQQTRSGYRSLQDPGSPGFDAGWPSDTTTSCASTLKSNVIEAWKRRKKKNHRKVAWKRRKKRRQLKLDRLKPVPHRLKPD